MHRRSTDSDRSGRSSPRQERTPQEPQRNGSRDGRSERDSRRGGSQPRTPGPGTSQGSQLDHGTPISVPRTPGRRMPRGDVGQPSGRRLMTPNTPDSRGSRDRSPSRSRSPSSRSSGRGRRGGRGSRSSRRSSQAEASEGDGLTGATTQHDEAIIWGTTISLQEARETFRDFINNFRHPDERMMDDDTRSDAHGGEEAHFPRLLAEMAYAENYTLNVDCEQLYEYNAACQKLYEQLVRYPQEVIPIMDMVVNEVFEQVAPASSGIRPRPPVQVRVFNLRDVKRMRDLDPIDIDTLVSIRGMVIRTSSVIPDLRTAFFRCQACGATEEINVDRGRIDEPAVCEQCTARHSFSIVHNRCIFKDKQQVKLQEAPESIPEGETPHTVVLYTHEDLVDATVPGDRVLITGIFRAYSQRVNPRQRTLRSVFKSYVDVIHIRKADRQRLAAEDAAVKEGEFRAIVPEVNDVEAAAIARRKRVETMAENPDIYRDLAISLAPSIWEMDDVKKGLLLQMFGGATKDLGDYGKFRGEVNVLLCGDPGTSKSQLLGYVNKIAPRGVYTSGKGSSAVGLTAYVTKDPDTREPVLESGALVLSDRGVCCIDEFDKMNDATRSILHEVMEQQTVSVAKAGIICTLNARTSVLASANPVESRYNPRLSVVENIQLPPTLLSRFDLIYLVLDKCDRQGDRRLASHLVSLYFDPSKQAPARAPYSLQQVTEYISYARTQIQPALTEAAGELLVESYTEMRGKGAMSMGGAGRRTITATPRQLESLIRLSEAHARMRLHAEVTVEDVEEAVRLVNVATQRAATDPTTGTIDMDMIHTGRTALARDAVSQLKEAVMDLADSRQKGERMSLGELEKVMERGTHLPIDRTDLETALKSLADEGAIRYDGRRRNVVLRP